MKGITEAQKRSEDGIKKLRMLAEVAVGDLADVIVGTNGSYARREATSGSDVDLFYLTEGDPSSFDSSRTCFEETVRSNGLVLPSQGGVFSDVLRADELSKNIGGLEDSNVSLTRRLLLLLEGEWLLNEAGYRRARMALLNRYVPDIIAKDKIALFLLNDVIRYWRTICVDYEFKTQDGKKPRGVRLVKLRFSRMLMVFGGILAVAETYNLNAAEKRSRLLELFSVDVLSRIDAVVGSKSSNLRELYDVFLLALDNPETRAALASANYEETREFSDLRGTGRAFKAELINLLKQQYPFEHPIHKALIL